MLEDLCAFTVRSQALIECLVLGEAINIVFTLCFSLADNGWWCACTACSAVIQAAAKTSVGPKKEKALCIPPPAFFRPALIHYDARLVEGSSPHPVPPARLKLSNEIPQNFLTNNIFFPLGANRVFDLLIRVFLIEKRTSGMSDFSFIDRAQIVYFR